MTTSRSSQAVLVWVARRPPRTPKGKRAVAAGHALYVDGRLEAVFEHVDVCAQLAHAINEGKISCPRG